MYEGVLCVTMNEQTYETSNTSVYPVCNDQNHFPERFVKLLLFFSGTIIVLEAISGCTEGMQVNHMKCRNMAS